MPDPLDVFLGFVAGLLTGIVVQYFGFRFASRIEKMKRLSPHLEAAFPIVDKLNGDTRYAVHVQAQGEVEHLAPVLKKIALSLEEYRIWFAGISRRGMIPELESLNGILSGRLVGLFNYANLGRTHGLEYISQKMPHLASHCALCKNELKHQLSF